MAATFTAGVNWGTASTQTLTASLLATFINGTDIANIATPEMEDEAKPIFSGSTSPSFAPRTGDIWRDQAIKMVKRFDGTRFQPASEGFIMFNTGVTMVEGAAVAHGTTGTSVSRHATNRWAGVFGVTMTTHGQSQSAMIRFSGIGSALVTGTCTRGDLLFALGVGSPEVGGALRAVRDDDPTNGYNSASFKSLVEVAYALYNNAGVAGTVTCLIIR